MSVSDTAVAVAAVPAVAAVRPHSAPLVRDAVAADYPEIRRVIVAAYLYDRLGFRRAPEFDVDMAAHYGGTGAAPITALAYLRQLAPTRAACA